MSVAPDRLENRAFPVAAEVLSCLLETSNTMEKKTGTLPDGTVPEFHGRRSRDGRQVWIRESAPRFALRWPSRVMIG